MTIVAWLKNNVHRATWSPPARLGALVRREHIMTAIGIGWGCTRFAYSFVEVQGSSRSVLRLRGLARHLRREPLRRSPRRNTRRPGRLQFRDTRCPGVPLVHGPIADQHLEHQQCAARVECRTWRLNRRKIALLVGAIVLAFTDRPGLPEQLRGHSLTPGCPVRSVGRDYADPLRLRTPRGRRRWPWTTCLGMTWIACDVRWSAIFSFIVGAVAAWCFEYGEWVGDGPGRHGPSRRRHDMAGRIVAGAVYLVIGRPSVSPLFAAELQAGQRRKWVCDATCDPQWPVGRPGAALPGACRPAHRRRPFVAVEPAGVRVDEVAQEIDAERRHAQPALCRAARPHGHMPHRG